MTWFIGVLLFFQVPFSLFSLSGRTSVCLSLVPSVRVALEHLHLRVDLLGNGASCVFISYRTQTSCSGFVFFPFTPFSAGSPAPFPRWPGILSRIFFIPFFFLLFPVSFPPSTESASHSLRSLVHGPGSPSMGIRFVGGGPGRPGCTLSGATLKVGRVAAMRCDAMRCDAPPGRPTCADMHATLDGVMRTKAWFLSRQNLVIFGVSVWISDAEIVLTLLSEALVRGKTDFAWV